MSAILVDAVVKDGRIVILDQPFYLSRAERMAKKWGEGAAIVIRIEPQDDAIKYHQFKHLYGHLFTPVAARTGETVADVAIRMKVAFMPDDGRTSLTQLTEAELKTFTESAEQDIRENDADSWDDCVAAMALYDRKTA